jgi:hypothetical protein
MRADNNLGHLLAWHDHEAALSACRRGMEMANRLGDVRFIASFSWAVAAYLDLDGQFEEARRIRDDAREKVELPQDSQLWYERKDLTAAAIQGDQIAADTALDLARRMDDSNNPQAQAASPAQRAELLWLAGEFEAAYDQALELEHNSPLPDNYLIAFYAAAMLGHRDKLERIAEGLGRCSARGRLVTLLELSVAGAIAALDGRTDDAIGEFSEALGLGLLRLERALAQAVFAAVVGRDVAQARQAGDAAYQVFADTGATAYIELLAPGLPSEAGGRAAGE